MKSTITAAYLALLATLVTAFSLVWSRDELQTAPPEGGGEYLAISRPSITPQPGTSPALTAPPESEAPAEAEPLSLIHISEPTRH